MSNSRGIMAQPRVRLATLPTPLHEAPRLRRALGGDEHCPRILIKRDDLTGLAFGGNKARKLEFLVADALRQGATRLITAGAAQSNHARMTAAAARLAGLDVSLVLTTPAAPPAPQGNLLLDRLLGADIHFVPTGTSEDTAMAELAETQRATGERPYVIPVGGSNAIGTFGYVAATLEIVEQLQSLGLAPQRLYYANGSRGTQAGLVLGQKMFSAPYAVHGIGVSGGDEIKRVRALQIANEASALLDSAIRLSDDDLLNDDDQIGPGYGVPTAACLEAIDLLARNEAIFLDPVYSAKAMAGLIGDIRQGQIAAAETIIFLHTGGTPALFAHAETLSKTER
ncbi:MAG TPA: D-cysteine desulfhydrase family protein [Thermomicrobiales bacterium]|jgi:D-cysteine desulfhydrase family pyridoxal phosphate-dependent enzyme